MPLSHLPCCCTRILAKPHVAVLVLAFSVFSACTSPEFSRTDESTHPQRVISLVPTVTETLFALGVGDRVVGVSDFDNYPPEAIGLPRVGALVNPNLEEIFELQPDLVFTYRSQFLLRERLGAANIRQHSVVSGSIDQSLASIRSVSLIMGVEPEGIRLVDQIREALEEIRDGAGATRPSVLFVHSRKVGTMGAFYSGGSQSYFNELIEIGGGRNIFADVGENVFQPSLEEILDRSPEVIIELLPGDPSGTPAIGQRMADWQALTSVPAVRNRRIYILSGDHLLLVGPRIHLAAADIANSIRDGKLTSESQDPGLID